MADILLIYPNLFHPNIGPPLSLLYLASALEKEGFRVRVIDERIEPETIANLHEEIGEDTLFAGMSSLTGPQIRSTLRIAKKIRESRPHLPIVLGGVHASLLPEQSIRHELIDIVVCGEGEFTVVDLANRLKNGHPLDGLKGIFLKKDGQVISNPPRAIADFNHIPMPAWHHIEPHLDAYLKTRDNRLMVQFSRGCPFRCSFCYTRYLNERKFRSKDVPVILAELQFIKDTYGITRFDFCDDNFITHKKKIFDFCDQVKMNHLDLDILLSMRINMVSSELLAKLRDAGIQKLFIGIESGSQEVLDELQKDLNPDQIKAAVDDIGRSGIEAMYSFMFNIPGESMTDLLKTKELAEYIHHRSPGALLWIRNYNPYPGTQLYEKIITSYSFNEPKSLEEWAFITWDEPTKKYFLPAFSNSFSEGFQLMWSLRFPQKAVNQKMSVLRYLIKKWSDFRFNHNLFRCLPEFRSILLIKRLVRAIRHSWFHKQIAVELLLAMIKFFKDFARWSYWYPFRFLVFRLPFKIIYAFGNLNGFFAYGLLRVKRKIMKKELLNIFERNI